MQDVFHYYCLYLVLQMVLSSGFATYYFKILAMSEEAQKNLESTKLLLQTVINSLTVVALALWCYFFYIEMKKFKMYPKLYLSDYSNWLDLCSQMLSLSFFIVLDYTIILDEIIVPVTKLRIWGGAACMLMWIRMFQWMRLFEQTAHFITLLSQVLKDLRTFNCMWMIVIGAFGNFFYVINFNTAMGEEDHWTGNYTCISILNAAIQMYMFSIGELDIKSVRNTTAMPHPWVGFLFFVLATFVLNVIFMNLIISIIQDTYQQAKDKAEENSLYERANLIKNMLWLIDVKKLFQNQRYIVHVYIPDIIEKDGISDLDQDFQEIQNEIYSQSDSNVTTISKKIVDFDRNSTTTLKSIYSVQSSIKERVQTYEQQIKNLEHSIKHTLTNSPHDSYKTLNLLDERKRDLERRVKLKESEQKPRKDECHKCQVHTQRQQEQQAKLEELRRQQDERKAHQAQLEKAQIER